MNALSSTKTFYYKAVAIVMIAMLALVAIPVTPAHAAACTFTATGTGALNWSTLTWTKVGVGCSTYPGQTFSGDSVTLGNNQTITLDVALGQSLASITFPSNNANATTLNITGQTVTVTGTVTINRSNTGVASNTLNVGTGTLTAASIAFSNSGTTSRHLMTISTGTVTVTGNVTEDAAGDASPAITFLGAGTLNLGGALWTTATGGTLTTFTGSTVNYNGAAQTAKVTTYSNLTLSGSGAKTFATTPTVDGILSLEGTATVTVTTGVVTYGSAATLQFNKPAAYTVTSEEWTTPFAGTGGVIVKNTGAITPGARNITNNLEISTGGVVNISNAMTANTLTFAGVPQAYGTWSDAGATNNDPVRFLGSTANLTVGKKTLTISGLTGTNKVYNATTTASFTGTATLVGVLPADTANVTLGGSPTATFADKNVGTAKTITVSGYTLSGSASGNYILTQPTLSADITAKALTAQGTLAASNKVYDTTTAATLTGAAALQTAEAAGTGTTSDGKPYTGDTVTLGGSSTGTFASANVGTGITVNVSGLSISGAQSSNYTLTAPSLTANITAKALTVTGITASNKVYDATTSATIDTTSAALVGNLDGGNVVLSVASATGAFTPNGNIGTGKTVQIAGLSISGSAIGNYTLTQPTTTANITVKSLTVTGITASNKTYDGTTSATLDTTSAALVGNLDGGNVVLNTASAIGTFIPNENVATGKTVQISGLSITGSAIGNYTLTQPTTTADITALALTGSLAASNKTYDGSDSASITCSLPGAIGGDNVNCSGTATFSDKNVGNGKTVSSSDLSLSGTDAGNYTLNPSASTTANITAIALTGSITADNKAYDGNNTATIATRSLLGVILSEDVSYVGGTATFSDKNVANDKTVSATGLSLSGADAGNYTVNTSASTTANITAKELTVSGVTANDKTYDGTTSATLNTGSAALVGVVGSEDVTLGGTPSGTFTDANAGTGKTVTISGYTKSGADAGNYSLTQPTTTATISQLDVTVTADPATKVYGNSDPAFSFAHNPDPLVGTDDFTGALSRVSGENAGTYAITIGSLTVGANYNVIFTGADLTITQRPITVTAVTDTKVYDGTTSSSGTPTVGALQFSDTPNFAQTFDNRNAGNNKTLTPAGTVNDGNGGANYAYTFDAVTTGKITKLPVTVTAVTDTKEYDGTTDSSGTPDISPALISPDSASYIQTFDNKNVGTGKTLTPSGFITDGNGGGNYAVTLANDTTGEITAKEVTITAVDKAIHTGNPDPTFTFNESGLVSPDTLTTPPTCGVTGSHSTAGTYPIVCSGGNAGSNYTISYVDGTLTVTDKIILQVTVDDQTITYGDADPTFSPNYSGFQGTDDESVLTTAPTCDASGPFTHVSSPFAIICSGGFDDTYDFNYTNGTLTVDPLAVTVTADDQTKTYGASDPALTYTNSPNLVGTDSFSGALTRDAGENVGTYTIKHGTLDLDANYTLTYVSDNLTITKADLTVTADDQTIWVGDTDPAFTASYTGFQNGETASVLNTAPTCGVTGAHTAAGTYTIACSGGSDNNYNFATYNDGTLTVNALLVSNINSKGAQDGWILESSETSNKGGTMNATATTFQLGDDNSDKQYKAILSFRTAALPDNATITSVVIKIKQSGKPTGSNPFSILSGLLVDIRNGSFGTSPLQIADFQTNTSVSKKVGTFNKTPASGWYSVTLNATGRGKVNKTGLTQVRLYFTKDDNDDLAADFMKFFSGNNGTNKPVIIITYKTP